MAGPSAAAGASPPAAGASPPAAGAGVADPGAADASTTTPAVAGVHGIIRATLQNPALMRQISHLTSAAVDPDATDEDVWLHISGIDGEQVREGLMATFGMCGRGDSGDRAGVRSMRDEMRRAVATMVGTAPSHIGLLRSAAERVASGAEACARSLEATPGRLDRLDRLDCLDRLDRLDRLCHLPTLATSLSGLESQVRSLADSRVAQLLELTAGIAIVILRMPLRILGRGRSV